MILTAAPSDPYNLGIVGKCVRCLTGFLNQLPVQLRHIPRRLKCLAHGRPCRFRICIFVRIIAVFFGDHPFRIMRVGPVCIIFLQPFIDPDIRLFKCFLRRYQPVRTDRAGTGSAGTRIIEGPPKRIDRDRVLFRNGRSLIRQRKRMVFIFQKDNPLCLRAPGKFSPLLCGFLRGHTFPVQPIIVRIPFLRAFRSRYRNLRRAEHRVHNRTPILHHTGDHD